jgi:hypothetical protein
VDVEVNCIPATGFCGSASCWTASFSCRAAVTGLFGAPWSLQSWQRAKAAVCGGLQCHSSSQIECVVVCEPTSFCVDQNVCLETLRSTHEASYPP